MHIKVHMWDLYFMEKAIELVNKLEEKQLFVKEAIC